MKAARFYGVEDLRVEEVKEPPTPQGHEVRLRNTVAGICGTDLHEYAHGPAFVSTDAHPLTGARMPQILGHEYAGTVDAIGPEVTDIAVGQRVSVMPQIYCGRCPACLRGEEQLCVQIGAIGLSWDWGGFSGYSNVPDTHVFPMPDSMTDASGALVEPTAVAVHATDASKVRPGEVILVTGAGPIGLLVGLAVKAAGATPLISEPNANRLARAEGLAMATNDPSAVPVAESLRELGFAAADSCIECSGAEPALAACIESVRTGGTVVQTGIHGRPPTVDMFVVTTHDINLVGRIAYPVRSWPRVIRLIASGAIPAEGIVTGDIELDDIEEQGFKHLLDPRGDGVKVLVNL
jgi:(R,R)-butanediol dehydrogenase/meso-butanediol dehydrogenase/diacetyl reductase